MSNVQGCFCIGPQNGEPKCPCLMRQERWGEFIRQHIPVRDYEDELRRKWREDATRTGDRK